MAYISEFGVRRGGWVMAPFHPVTATTEDFAKQFGMSLRWARKHDLGLTQAELAARITRVYVDAGESIRVTQGNVSRWEKGYHVPRKHLPALLQALDHEYAWFFTDHTDGHHA